MLLEFYVAFSLGMMDHMLKLCFWIVSFIDELHNALKACMPTLPFYLVRKAII